MVDKFGGFRRGRPGPPGPSGKNALDIGSWLPEGVVKMFRESEQCTYYFDTESDGILEEDKKHSLKDRYGKNHAVCIQNFQKPVKLGKLGVYGLPLKNTKFKLNILDEGLIPKSVLIIVFSFKVTAPLGENPTYIFSNKSGSRAVSINNKQLDVWGATASPQLEYDKGQWNTMLLQYSRITESGKDQCFFILNGDLGTFEPKVYDFEREFYIGGSPERKTAPIMLGSFEVYSKIFDKPVDEYLLPKQIYKPLMEYVDDRFDR